MEKIKTLNLLLLVATLFVASCNTEHEGESFIDIRTVEKTDPADVNATTDSNNEPDSVSSSDESEEAVDSGGSVDSVSSEESANPDAPSALSMVSPAASAGEDDTPTIRVSGVSNGDTVYLYKNSTCSELVKSASSTGTTVDITTDTLAVGSYTFYATTKSSANKTSECSSANVSYEVQAGAPEAPTGLSMVSPAASAGTDTTPTIRVSGVANGDTVYLYKNSTCSELVKSASSTGTTVDITTDVLAAAAYTFYATRKDSNNKTSACSTAKVSYEVLGDLKPPTSLTIAKTTDTSADANNQGQDTTPTITVGGVESGDTVYLYSDNKCTSLLKSGTAASTTINLTTNTLSVGKYNFYAKRRDKYARVSACSTATVAYEVLSSSSSCPDGYIDVPANGDLKTSAFCVMQFEVKNPGGKGVPTSAAADVPWVSISAEDAKDKCTGLGENYDLISNIEWLAIAYDIEGQDANWSEARVGSGLLNRGHSDNDPPEALAVADTNDPYDGTKNDSKTGPAQKRTHTLSNKAVIWDFTGNVWEWVDWTLGSTYVKGPTTCSTSWQELKAVSCAEMSDADYMPNNPANVDSEIYNSDYGLGKFWGGSNGATMRGGDAFGTEANVGLYAMMLNQKTTVGQTFVGFRCVYRPPAK